MGHLKGNILFMFHHIHGTFKFREFGAAAFNLTTLGKIMTTLCFVSQYRDLASYQHGMDSPFGDLFYRYLEIQSIPSSGACF